ncbi:MAG: hypothetical protein IKB87_03050 [Clostridia bacterium]|nr:hypothetical protein [Clostridia bacterium]
MKSRIQKKRLFTPIVTGEQMKLYDFVKKEPKRASIAIIWISLVAAFCLTSLIALGAVAAYRRSASLKTNVRLIASDLLSLRDGIQNGDETEVQITSALISARTPLCLDKRDAETLNAIVSEKGNRFLLLCEKIETLSPANRLDCMSLSDIIHTLDSMDNPETITPESPNEPATHRKTDQAKEAAKFFGINDLFSSAEDGAYCGNLYIAFDQKNRMMNLYAVECVPTEIRITEDACKEKITEFLRKKLAITRCKISEVKTQNGIYLADIAEAEKPFARIGIRRDTGSVCFFLTY